MFPKQASGSTPYLSAICLILASGWSVLCEEMGRSVGVNIPVRAESSLGVNIGSFPFAATNILHKCVVSTTFIMREARQAKTQGGIVILLATEQQHREYVPFESYRIGTRRRLR